MYTKTTIWRYTSARANPGRKHWPFLLNVMLRIHLLLQWFTLSDPFMDQMLIDTSSIRGRRPLDSGVLLLQ